MRTVLVLAISVLLGIVWAGCSADDALVRQYCRHDADCPSGQICADSGVCVPKGSLPRPDGDADLPDTVEQEQDQEQNSGGCIDEDRFKNNHASDLAVVISPGVYSFLSICPGADDWYKFSVSNTTKYAFLYLRALTPYSLGLGGRLYSGYGVDLASHDNEGIVFLVHEINNSVIEDFTEVKVQVVPEVFNTRYPQLNLYHMGVLTSEDFECQNQDEPNNSLQDATALEEGIYVFDLCEDDEADYFKVVLPKRQNLFAAVALGQFDPPAVVELLDSDGALLQRAISQQIVEFKYPGSATAERTMYLVVEQGLSTEAVKFKYILDLNLTYEPPFVCTDDGYEPNDDKEHASPWQVDPPASLYGLSLCPTSTVDWFEVSLSSPQRLLIAVASLDDMQAQFRIQVYSTEGELLAESDSSSVSTALEFEFASQSALLRIDATNLTDRGVRYNLSIDPVQ